jgi:GH24 family phage-related lysozyme (muramidase)
LFKEALATEIDTFFKPLTTEEALERIQKGRGKKGIIAEAYLKNLTDITFTWQEALETFEHHILPKFEKYALSAFPGVEHLASSAQTALVSLVFNRGTSMKGPSRVEMRRIRDLVPDKNYKEIARQIVCMKRLWAKGSGLLARRDREAALVKGCS